jgi:hypothetical protein
MSHNDNEDDHYVYLSSLASHIEYPENKITRYTNRMNPPLHLKGSWSVGLINTFFSTDFLSVHKDDPTFEIKIALSIINKKGKSQDIIETVYRPTVDISDKSIYLIIRNIELDLRKFLINGGVIHPNSSEIFSYTDNNKTILFHPLNLKSLNNESIINYKGVWVCRSNIAALLGVAADTQLLFSNNVPIISAMAPVLYSGVNNVYIYTDIVKSSRVGDGQSDLLDIIAVGNTFSKSINTIVYKAVKLEYIETISILMTDQNGRNIKFNDGSGSIAILHFRRQ